MAQNKANNKRIKIIRATTVPTSLETFCNGLLRQLQEEEGYEVVAVSSPGPEMETIAQREGVRVASVPMQRQIAPVSDLKSLIGLIKLFRRERPQMVHSMTPKAGLLCMMAARITRVPVRLHTFTGLIFPTAKGIKQKILILTDRLTCACATHIIPEGEGVKNDLINYHITGKDLKVLGHGNVRGIDPKHYDRTPQVEAEADKIRKTDIFTFVFIGRIVRDKGINELIHAFNRLYEDTHNIRLLLVGRYESSIDPISAETQQIIDNHKAIEPVGTKKDVRPWLAASDAFVFPSYREGFPNVVIEAGAMGLPSIVTDINGSREIIQNNVNGLIIPAHDTESLYQTMKSLINDKKLTSRLASNARKMVVDRFEQTFVRKCLTDYYRNIL